MGKESRTGQAGWTHLRQRCQERVGASSAAKPFFDPLAQPHLSSFPDSPPGSSVSLRLSPFLRSHLAHVSEHLQLIIYTDFSCSDMICANMCKRYPVSSSSPLSSHSVRSSRPRPGLLFSSTFIALHVFLTLNGSLINSNGCLFLQG